MENKKSLASSLFVTVRDREKIVFEEEVEAITSNNEVGIFDVLPEHTSFITIIKDFLIIHRKKAEKQHMKVDQGVLKVNSNKVFVYLGV